MFKVINALKKIGVVGMNQRNLDFVLPYNTTEQRLLVDDKISTKKLAQNANLPVPELFDVISVHPEINNFPQNMQAHSEFVIKPAHGSGGKGILIIKDKLKDRFKKNNDEILTADQIKQHISKVLSGVFSLGGYPDQAVFEHRVNMSRFFAKITYHGVPDIRIILYRGFPLMAMLRLPTIQSNGKANLHQGAIGVGINMYTGVTTYGVQGNECIDEHPDTLNTISGITIPSWNEILDLAIGCYELSGLGFAGVDIVIDEELGPQLLEINARPGLNIQIANRDGIKRRAIIIDELLKNHDTLSRSEKIALTKNFY